jgi:acyl phosphate:glycerol-3-phosphate acyltransferase
MKAVLIIFAGYLLGSIPFGYLIVRAKAGADIRETGSGGTGATNVSRRAGKFAGLLTLVLDALKGVAAVFLARFIAGPDQNTGWLVAAAGLTVIVGHMYPVWLGFRGGKGVATGLGVFLGLAPLAAAFAAILFLIVVVLTRYVSAGSIAAAVALPLFVWLQNKYVKAGAEQGPILLVATIGALLLVFAHRANIVRLMQGRENKFK